MADLDRADHRLYGKGERRLDLIRAVWLHGGAAWRHHPGSRGEPARLLSAVHAMCRSDRLDSPRAGRQMGSRCRDRPVRGSLAGSGRCTYHSDAAVKYNRRSRCVNRPPEVRPQNLTIGGRFSYGKI